MVWYVFFTLQVLLELERLEQDEEMTREVLMYSLPFVLDNLYQIKEHQYIDIFTLSQPYINPKNILIKKIRHLLRYEWGKFGRNVEK